MRLIHSYEMGRFRPNCSENGPRMFRKRRTSNNRNTSEVRRLVRFARTEGRFAKHFDKDGNPSETLIKAKQERLDNWHTWHTLQELAGII